MNGEKIPLHTFRIFSTIFMRSFTQVAFLKLPKSSKTVVSMKTFAGNTGHPCSKWTRLGKKPISSKCYLLHFFQRFAYAYTICLYKMFLRQWKKHIFIEMCSNIWLWKCWEKLVSREALLYENLSSNWATLPVNKVARSWQKFHPKWHLKKELKLIEKVQPMEKWGTIFLILSL